MRSARQGIGRRDDRRGDAGAAVHLPAARLVGLIDGYPGVRVGDCGHIGDRALRAAGSACQDGLASTREHPEPAPFHTSRPSPARSSPRTRLVPPTDGHARRCRRIPHPVAGVAGAGRDHDSRVVVMAVEVRLDWIFAERRRSFDTYFAPRATASSTATARLSIESSLASTNRMWQAGQPPTPCPGPARSPPPSRLFGGRVVRATALGDLAETPVGGGAAGSCTAPGRSPGPPRRSGRRTRRRWPRSRPTRPRPRQVIGVLQVGRRVPGRRDHRTEPLVRSHVRAHHRQARGVPRLGGRGSLRRTDPPDGAGVGLAVGLDVAVGGRRCRADVAAGLGMWSGPAWRASTAAIPITNAVAPSGRPAASRVFATHQTPLTTRTQMATTG